MRLQGNCTTSLEQWNFASLLEYQNIFEHEEFRGYTGCNSIHLTLVHQTVFSCAEGGVWVQELEIWCLVASFPGPSPPLRRGLVHTVCACAKYSVTFSVKSFVHFLVCMRNIILTKNTELSLRYTLATWLTCTEPGWDTFQRCQYHFSKQIDLPKRAVSSHTRSHRNTYLSSYTVCSDSALNAIRLLQQKQRTIQP